jgi:hypothetical protein
MLCSKLECISLSSGYRIQLPTTDFCVHHMDTRIVYRMPIHKAHILKVSVGPRYLETSYFKSLEFPETSFDGEIIFVLFISN